MFKNIFAAIKKCVNAFMDVCRGEDGHKTAAMHRTPKTAPPSPERDNIRTEGKNRETPSPPHTPSKEENVSANKTPAPKTHLEVTQERAREAIKKAQDTA